MRSAGAPASAAPPGVSRCRWARSTDAEAGWGWRSCCDLPGAPCSGPEPGGDGAPCLALALADLERGGQEPAGDVGFAQLSPGNELSQGDGRDVERGVVLVLTGVGDAD